MTVLGPGQATPAPWINVVSNPSFGFQVSAEGSGYTGWLQVDPEGEVDRAILEGLRGMIEIGREAMREDSE